MNTNGNPKVFISYSWNNQQFVKDLADRLISDGIDVIIDIYDLREGADKYVFMEQSVSDSSIDRVLIICDKVYTQKANQRKGGVGDETAIITSEIYGNVSQEKFIPIIIEHDDEEYPYCPAYISTRIFIDLSADNPSFEDEYEKLIRNIHNERLFRKPAIGSKPEWLSGEDIDFSKIRGNIKHIENCQNVDAFKLNLLIKETTDHIIDKQFEYRILTDPYKDNGEEFLRVLNKTKIFKDLVLDFCESIFKKPINHGEEMAGFVEALYNGVRDKSRLEDHFQNANLEIYNFLLHELFISIAALMLHYELYSSLNTFITYTYFFRKSVSRSDVRNQNFLVIRPVYKYINEICDSVNESKHLSLASKIMLSREKRPIFTKYSLINADLVLYQLSIVFDIKEYNYGWFPCLYIYDDSQIQPIWQKLISRKYCEKIFPLFGVQSIDDLKQMVSKSVHDSKMKYNESYYSALSIQDSIKIDKIGTIQ